MNIQEEIIMAYNKYFTKYYILFGIDIGKWETGGNEPDLKLWNFITTYDSSLRPWKIWNKDDRYVQNSKLTQKFIDEVINADKGTIDGKEN